MIGIDELERLSRFAAGELPERDAAQIRAELQRRPELAKALEQLQELDGAIRALPATLDASRANALVGRAIGSPPRLWKGWPLLAMAATAAGVIALAAMAARREFIQLIPLAGPVSVNGQLVASPSEPMQLLDDAVMQTGAQASAMVEGRGKTLFLPRDSTLALLGSPRDGRFELRSGTVAASGQQVRLAAGGALIELSGRAALSWEPEDILLRVTEAMESDNLRETKARFNWLKLPLAATVASGAVVSLLVFEGRAKVSPPAEPAVEVAAGQKWSSRSPRASAIASRPTALETKSGVASTAAASLSGDSVERLSQAELMKEVKGLRQENSSLLQRNKQLEQRVAALDPSSNKKTMVNGRLENFYRQDADTLRAWAENGEVHLHPPPRADGTPYNAKVRDELGLTPQEEAAIRDIYARSRERIHEGLVSMYKEIGGDPNVARTLEDGALMNELAGKRSPGEPENISRRAARERAGLDPIGDPNQGPMMLRVYRLFWREEERVLQELDELLGSARAEQFVNHEGTSHSTMTTSSGPDRSRR